MTVNIAVWFDDTVLLLADLGVTRKNGDAPKHDRGPLGQRQYNDKGQFVIAELAKVARLGPFSSATICGDLAPALRFLRMMHINVGMCMDLRSAIRDANRYAREVGGDFSCFVAGLENGWTRLYQSTESAPALLLNEGRRDCPMVPGAVVEGSLSPSNAAFVMEYIKVALQQSAACVDVRLAKVLACANAACVQEDLVAENVSGPLFGIRVDSGGARWQQDMVYVPWENKDFVAAFLSSLDDRLRDDNGSFEGGGFARCCVRDDVLCVSSSISRAAEETDFFQRQDEIDGSWSGKQQWLDRHGEDLSADGGLFGVGFYALIPSYHGVVVGGSLATFDIRRGKGTALVSLRLLETVQEAVEGCRQFIAEEFSESKAQSLTWLTETKAPRSEPSSGNQLDPTVIRAKMEKYAVCACGSGRLRRRCHGRFPARPRPR